MSKSERNFIDKAFKDEKGEWALAAKPNLPIIVWFIMLFPQHLLHGDLSRLASVIGRGALFTWAWLELFQGVNYFRRVLGAVVLVFTIWSAMQK